mmetsp:Transcript_13797/g.46627  ORF Transcript_13797/g.46627 Transcript_13797/m.46627 type:complete len:126 (-) Transcript_13797:156-533(-)
MAAALDSPNAIWSPRHGHHSGPRGLCVVGMKYRGAAGRRICRLGAVVRLELDPTNPYDPNAIKVLHDGQHAAFVRREDSALLAQAAPFVHLEGRPFRVTTVQGSALYIVADGPPPGAGHAHAPGS